MLKEKQVIIGEHEYTLYQFMATEGTIVLLELAKILGTPLGVLADNIKNAIAGSGSKSIKQILDSESGELIKIASKMSIENIVSSLVSNLDVAETMRLIKTLFKKIKVKNTDGSFVVVAEIYETHFQGEYILLFKLLKEAIEFQYGGFFSLFQNIRQIASTKELIQNP